MSALPRMLPLFDVALFEATLVSWAEQAADVTAIWDAEDGPQPDRSYVTFSLLTADSYHPATRIDDTDVNTGNISRGYYKMELIRVQILALSDSNKPRENAHNICESMMLGLNSDQYKEQLFLPAGIGLNTNTPVRRLPMLEDGVRWRSKAVFEVDFNVACNQAGVEQLIPVESVGMTGTLVGGVNGDITIPETVTT